MSGAVEKITRKRTKVLYLAKGQAPFTVQVDPKTGERTTHTTARAVYAERPPGGKPSRIRTEPGPHRTVALTDAEVKLAETVARKYGWKLIKRDASTTIVRERWPHLDGDLDCHEDVLDALEAVGAELHVNVFVRSGRRTMDEQWALWNLYGPPRAAYPNANAPHVRGVAADTGIGPNRVDIGEYPGARAAMKRHGLCLRVPGEDWHVERGTTWAA